MAVALEVLGDGHHWENRHECLLTPAGVKSLIRKSIDFTFSQPKSSRNEVVIFDGNRLAQIYEPEMCELPVRVFPRKDVQRILFETLREYGVFINSALIEPDDNIYWSIARSEKEKEFMRSVYPGFGECIGIGTKTFRSQFNDDLSFERVTEYKRERRFLFSERIKPVRVKWEVRYDPPYTDPLVEYLANLDAYA